MNSEFSARSAKYRIRQRVEPSIAPLATAVSGALAAGSLQAATITVDTLNGAEETGACSLRSAIYAAYIDGATDSYQCAYGEEGEDTIVFDSGLSGTVQLTNSDGGFYFDGSTLLVESEVTIEGDGRIEVAGTGNAPVFYARYTSGPSFNSASFTVRGLEITGGGGNLGAGIYSRSTYLAIESSFITGNDATQRGGGVWHVPYNSASPDAGLYIGDDSSIGLNSANQYGGGVYARQNGSGNIEIGDTIFYNNYAGYDGGAVLAEASGGDVYASGIYAAGNEASFGGAFDIRTQGGSVGVEYSEFVNNDADGGCGGAINVSGSPDQVAIGHSVFFGNSTAGCGGAVSIDAPGNENALVEIKYSELTDNLASTTISGGGAVYANLGSGTTMAVSNSTISGNESNAYGGGLYLAGNMSAEVKYSTLANNYAAYDGGGLYSSVDDCTVNDSIFAGNQNQADYQNLTGSPYCSVSETLFQPQVLGLQRRRRQPGGAGSAAGAASGQWR
ncbi:MAG: hypothetical protein U5L08_01990 [Xanthomonadales bacterium]|nr:hypothetical protein [Xanthomonadales bacterium]